MPKRAASARALCFVDARGGAFAAMAAAIARAQGKPNAIAATTSEKVDVPAEIAAVLAEINASAPEVVPASKVAKDAERVDLASFIERGLALHEGEGQLERLALARIARDRIERRLATAP